MAGFGRVDKEIYRFLDTVGDGSGTKNANGNYSNSGGQNFLYVASDPVPSVLWRLIVNIRDGGGGFSADGYGGLAALSNGITISVRDSGGGVLLNITDDVPIQSNGDWARFCFDTGVDDFGSGDDFLKVRWTFANSGRPLILNPGERFVVNLADDLTGLTSHYFNLQGFRL